MNVFAQDAPQGNSQNRHSDPEEVIVSEWPLNKREIARVTLGVYRGIWLINFRKWFEGDDGDMRPGKGFAVSAKHLPHLAEAATKALFIARERRLIETDREGDR
jgi:hypothetical protein